MSFQDQALIEQSLLELVWNNTNDAIFTIGYDGRILSSNPAFSVILGWEREDFQDKLIFPFFTNTTIGDHEQLLNTLRSGKDIPYYVTKRVRKDGKVLDILASYRSVNKKEVLAVGMYKDFTEQMEIQRKLQASQYCYRNLVEFIPDAIFVENDGKIVFVNKPGIQLIGANAESEVLGHSVWKFILTEVQSSFKRKILQSIKAGEAIIEKFKRLDGEIIWAEITVMRVLFEGEYVNQIMLRDITAKKNYEAQLEYLAFHDPLTGLPNRRSFAENLNQAINQALMNEKMLSVLYLDIDKFKGFNDSLGHEFGDQLLKQFSSRLKENVRGKDVLCRIGGDEFLILLNDIKEKRTVQEITTRLHKALEAPYFIDNQKIVATSSIGIALFPEDGLNSKTLITHADKALYQAKVHRNSYKFFGDVSE
ncbi:diguanylate cyclase domain-containing protein [Ureibacillus sp. NPDC094379]